MTTIVGRTPRRYSYIQSSFTEGDDEFARAACIGKSHLFEIRETRAGEDPDVTKRITIANFKEAKKICASCPVFQTCKDTAASEDRAFTFRAGEPPTSFSAKGRGRPSGWNGDVCKNGHEGDFYIRSDGGYKVCRQCKRKGPKPLSEKCPKGHNDWRYRPDGRRSCRECERSWRERRVNAFDPANYADRVCKRGHVGKYGIYGGDIQCVECGQEDNRNRYIVNGGKIAR